MIELLRALGWMRWRQARAALRGHSRRDALEQVLGLSAGVVRGLQVGLLGLAAAWFGLCALAAGYFAAAGGERGATKAALLTGLAATLATVATIGSRLVAGPRAGHASTQQRLLLLPIHPRHLRALHLLTGLAEPWPLIALPALLLLPVGLVAGGRVGAAVAMLTAGFGLGLLLLLLGTLSADGAALVLRSRRRAETLGLALAVGLILPGALLPLLLPSRPANSTPVLDPAPPPAAAPVAKEEPWAVERLAARALWATPPGLYTDAVRRVAHGGSPWPPILLLALWTVPLAFASRATYERLVAEPDHDGGGRGAGRATELAVLPLVGPGVSAVAIAHLWLAGAR